MKIDVEAMLEAVVDEQPFLQFLKALALDWEDEQQKPTSSYDRGANGWENGTIGAYLDAAATRGTRIGRRAPTAGGLREAKQLMAKTRTAKKVYGVSSFSQIARCFVKRADSSLSLNGCYRPIADLAQGTRSPVIRISYPCKGSLRPVLGFTQACSAKYPENAAQYEAKLEKLVAENPQVYKKLNSDAEFVAKLNEVKQGINSMTPDELRIECSRLRDE